MGHFLTTSNLNSWLCFYVLSKFHQIDDNRILHVNRDYGYFNNLWASP